MSSKSSDREKRLREALRVNLQRRKLKARTLRASGPQDPGPEGTDGQLASPEVERKGPSVLDERPPHGAGETSGSG